MQFFLDIMINPEYWKMQKIIFVKKNSVKNLIGIKGGYASVLNSKNKIVYEDIKKKNIHIYDFGDSTNTVLVTGGRPFTFSLNKVKSSPNECSSKEFNQLLNIAETQTQAGNYIEALDSYTKAYDICPMRDLEEQMAWLLSEIGGK